MLHLKRRFYEALCVLHASGVSSAQKHEAALRAMKQSLTASFRHFFLLFKNALMGLPSFHSGYPAFLQKNGGESGIRTLDYSPCKITLKKMFYSAF